MAKRIREVPASSMRMLRPPPNTCPECATPHPADAAHNRDSLTYIMGFKLRHGLEPTWADAMKHCDEPMKEIVAGVLGVHNVEIGETVEVRLARIPWAVDAENCLERINDTLVYCRYCDAGAQGPAACPKYGGATLERESGTNAPIRCAACLRAERVVADEAR